MHPETPAVLTAQLKVLKNSLTELKNKLRQMGKNLDGLNIRLNQGAYNPPSIIKPIPEPTKPTLPEIILTVEQFAKFFSKLKELYHSEISLDDTVSNIPTNEKFNLNIFKTKLSEIYGDQIIKPIDEAAQIFAGNPHNPEPTEFEEPSLDTINLTNEHQCDNFFDELKLTIPNFEFIITMFMDTMGLWHKIKNSPPSSPKPNSIKLQEIYNNIQVQATVFDLPKQQRAQLTPQIFQHIARVCDLISSPIKNVPAIWQYPTIPSNIDLKSIKIIQIYYSTLITKLKDRFTEIKQQLDQVSKTIEQQYPKEIHLSEILVEINKEKISDKILPTILFYEASNSIGSHAGRPFLYECDHTNISIEKLDQITAEDPLFNFNFPTHPKILWATENQIQQIPALFQSYTNLQGRYNTTNFMVLCGFYAAYFAATLLSNQNYPVIPIEMLNSRITFDLTYKKLFENKADSGWLTDKFIQDELVNKLNEQIKRNIVVGIQSNYFNQDAVIKFQKAQNASISIITQPWTGNHWYTIFAKKINHAIYFLIADSLAIDRRNDQRTKEWFKLLSRNVIT